MSNILQLNCWILGDHPDRVFSVNIASPGPCQGAMLKKAIKEQKHASVFNGIDADDLILWKVKPDLRLKEDFDLEAIWISGVVKIAEMLEPSETFTGGVEKRKLHIIVQLPCGCKPPTEETQESLRVLKALYDVLWNKPGALLERQTVEYEKEIVDEGEVRLESKSFSCDVFNLEEYVEGLSSIIPVCARLIVRQEYKLALQHMTDEFNQEERLDLSGFAVTGQPGIGKSLFLLYLLLNRMQGALPVAINTIPSGYFLADNHGVSWHDIGHSSHLDVHQDIWVLSDSNDEVTSPPYTFLQRCDTARVIHVTPPQMDCWHRWTQKFSALRYVMDIWEDEELALLAYVQFGQEKVTEMLRLSSHWGPGPRFLMAAIQNPRLENDMRDDVKDAAQRLVIDPAGVIVYIWGLSSERSVVWIHKSRICGDISYAYIPGAIGIAYAICDALVARNSHEQAAFFWTLSTRASCGVTGYLFEPVVYSALTNGPQPCDWFALPEDSLQRFTSVASERIITSVDDLKSAVVPFYFRPGQEDFPGINGALCTEEAIYAIQSTPSIKHSSATNSLDALNSALAAGPHQYPEKKWYLIFARENRDKGRKVAENQRGNLQANDSLWKNITIGYFIPRNLLNWTCLSKFYSEH